MTVRARWLARAAGSVAVILAVAAASLILAATSTGVLTTGDGQWTTRLDVAGRSVLLNVPGLIRLATLPGIAHLADGHALATRAGTLRFERAGRQLRIRCAPCRVEHPDLATGPVVLGDAAMSLARHGDTLHGNVSVNGAVVEFTGTLGQRDLQLAWRLPPIPLAMLAAALGDTVPETAYARIEGTVHARGTLALPAWSSVLHWSAEHVEVGGLGTEALQYGWFRFVCSQPAGGTKIVISGDGEPNWVPADRTGRYLAAAVLAAEDQRFHQHAGIDEIALAQLLADLDGGRPRRGASTITQQLARTLYTGGERTVARKLREALYAVEMERTLGKARILELYLNTVDWGPGLCGVKAAARAYFGKAPARLTPIEAAWLAGILRNPHVAWRHEYLARTPQRERAAWVLMQMRDLPRRERMQFALQPLIFRPIAPVPPPAGAAPPDPVKALRATPR